MDTGVENLAALPIDVLCQVVKYLEIHDKLRLQLVCTKFYALLISPPPGEGLWGECHLPTDVSCAGDYTDPVVRR